MLVVFQPKIAYGKGAEMGSQANSDDDLNALFAAVKKASAMVNESIRSVAT